MTKWQVFRALQGHKIVAGGNAPGMRRVRAPTLKGSYYPERGPKTGVTPPGFEPFRVGPCGGHVFRGRCPRLLY